MDGGSALMYSSIREAVGSGIDKRMFSDLRSSHMIISMDKDLFCDALRNGQGEPILPRLSKVC
jgi:hypothetical protein